MKNLFSQLVKLECTSLMIVSTALLGRRVTSAAVSITSEVHSSFTSCENRFFIEYSISTSYGTKLVSSSHRNLFHRPISKSASQL